MCLLDEDSMLISLCSSSLTLLYYCLSNFIKLLSRCILLGKFLCGDYDQYAFYRCLGKPHLELYIPTVWAQILLGDVDLYLPPGRHYA